MAAGFAGGNFASDESFRQIGSKWRIGGSETLNRGALATDVFVDDAGSR